ncbi:ribonuclease E activity regulator RraA [Bacillus sp. B15-48]|uniref:ribonuclease E activity regulator RraA n=1 Tax=Bacillus sp. B15-48 TaxID=1548601 RepID=UPI00193F565B|nr:ribonuclease E activity regulator RraA [Bacillus sp. B15-48]MBM4764460.1 ribonuclease E activity regulator RraA [Bacillus sp. B15-48]
MDFKTADLCDDFASELAICQLEFKSYGKRPKFFGPICTVKVFEDNALVLESLQSIPEGSVLVVDGGGSRRRALMGDRLAEIAQNRKLAGVIINGCVRDVEDLEKLNVGIFAIGSVPLKSKKEGKGEKQVEVTFGGIEWKPGSYVYADQDGVVVSDRKLF